MRLSHLIESASAQEPIPKGTRFRHYARWGKNYQGEPKEAWEQIFEVVSSYEGDFSLRDGRMTCVMVLCKLHNTGSMWIKRGIQTLMGYFHCEDGIGNRQIPKLDMLYTVEVASAQAIRKLYAKHRADGTVPIGVRCYTVEPL